MTSSTLKIAAAVASCFVSSAALAGGQPVNPTQPTPNISAIVPTPVTINVVILGGGPGGGNVTPGSPGAAAAVGQALQQLSGSLGGGNGGGPAGGGQQINIVLTPAQFAQAVQILTQMAGNGVPGAQQLLTALQTGDGVQMTQ